MGFQETREGRRAAGHTPPEARDFMNDVRDGWRIVSNQSAGWGEDRCGLTAHRGVLHSDEYVDTMRLVAAVEQRLGFTVGELHTAYRQGRKSAAHREVRARIDARFLELRDAGGNLELLARITRMDRKTIGRALARARACAPDPTRAPFDVDRSVNARGVHTMTKQTATPSLDHIAVAKGLGELKAGNGYDRVLVDGKTVAYLKRGRIAVPTALVTKAPKKLASFTPEKSGPWSNAPVDTTAKARAIIEYVVARRAAQN